MLAAACACLQAKEVKVLTIGNSFAQSLGRYLPKVVESVEGCSIKLEFANFGGCSFQRHWQYICEEERGDKIHYGKGKQTLKSILQNTKWDFVTIQQASPLSWKGVSFFPESKHIADFVAKNAPGATILLQQTWSYRCDSKKLKSWKISQKQMFEIIRKNYEDASAKLGLAVIPSGYAVELYRATISEKFVPPTKEEIAKYKCPETPSSKGDIVGKYSWLKNKKGEKYLYIDSIHLNKDGEYLQACVWFAYLFDIPAADIKFKPKHMDEQTAKKMRQIADQAVREYKKSAPKNKN